MQEANLADLKNIEWTDINKKWESHAPIFLSFSRTVPNGKEGNSLPANTSKDTIVTAFLGSCFLQPKVK